MRSASSCFDMDEFVLYGLRHWRAPARRCQRSKARFTVLYVALKPASGDNELRERRISMIVVRNCFVAKPGQASKLAKLLEEVAVAAEVPRHRVMTELTSHTNRAML